MERARARVVRVKESRERERRDMCSSMAAQGPRGARGGPRDQMEQKVSPWLQMEPRERGRCFWEVLKLDDLPDPKHRYM